MTYKERMHEKLTEAFAPEALGFVEIQDSHFA